VRARRLEILDEYVEDDEAVVFVDGQVVALSALATTALLSVGTAWTEAAVVAAALVAKFQDPPPEHREQRDKGIRVCNHRRPRPEPLNARPHCRVVGAGDLDRGGSAGLCRVLRHARILSGGDSLVGWNQESSRCPIRGRQQQQHRRGPGPRS